MGQGERYYVLRLAQTGAAQLWDPLSGEALCTNSDQHQQPQQPLERPQTDEDLRKQQVEVLGLLQSIDAEASRIRQHISQLLPVAEHFAASQHQGLHQVLQASGKQDCQLVQSTQAQESAIATIVELRNLERRLVELQMSEEAYIREWRKLIAAESHPSPFFLGGPQQNSREGLWPVSRFSLLFSQQNAYINLQRMRCLNCRRSPLEESPTLRVKGEDPEEFVPLTASAKVPEDERHIRESIRSRLQRRQRWRCFGLPALVRVLTGAARSAASAKWWLNCYVKSINLLCCERYEFPGSRNRLSHSLRKQNLQLSEAGLLNGVTTAKYHKLGDALFSQAKVEEKHHDNPFMPVLSILFKRLGSPLR